MTDELLEGLLSSLNEVERLLSFGRDLYHGDAFLRPALQRLWITIGNHAERYRIEAGLPEGSEPWSELYLYRCVLAHALADEVDEGLVWNESVRDLQRIRGAVADRASEPPPT